MTTDDSHPLPKSEKRQFLERLTDELGIRPPASGGPFKEPLRISDVCRIGGKDDDNKTLTIRMLLLLEGEWLFNPDGFRDARQRLLDEYLHDKPGASKICMFLLNDIIRYWRTICIDLEHKANVANKPRALRLIKLRFSRMLLYVSGVLAVGDGYGIQHARERQNLIKHFDKCPIDRIQSIVTQGETEPILDLYAEFLESLDTPAIRDALDQEGGRDSPEFRRLTERARCFRDKLYLLLQEHFSDDNPTRRALML